MSHYTLVPTTPAIAPEVSFWIKESIEGLFVDMSKTQIEYARSIISPKDCFRMDDGTIL